MFHNTKNFFNFICERYLDGKEDEALELFKEMRPGDKKDFMNELNYCTFKDIPKSDGGPWQMDFLRRIIYSLKL